MLGLLVLAVWKLLTPLLLPPIVTLALAVAFVRVLAERFFPTDTDLNPGLRYA